MKTALRRFRGLPVAALALFTCAAGARPLLVPPQNLAVPQLPGVPADDFLSPTYGSVAIDEGTLLVFATRAINAQNDRVSGVYIFERNAEGRWAYAGILTEQWPGSPMLDGTVATVRVRGHQNFRTWRGGLGVDRHHRDRARRRLSCRRRFYLRATGSLPSHLRAAIPGVSQGEWRLDRRSLPSVGSDAIQTRRTSTMAVR